ncbi:MAG: tRNA lysidine(34) synthetase TilS, partial [Candidatus Saccharimonadales bacterium]
MPAAKPVIRIKPGRYILAVSGGVDSVVLLDLLADLPGLKLTVAHFDHGIRTDSKNDRIFVQSLAAAHNLPFVYDRAELGPGASEALARQARYQFLHKVRQLAEAQAVITAHHADDRLETAIINILRGTGRRGLSSLKSGALIVRPLLHTDKKQLVAYARDQNLRWHEDSTNQDDSYLRNYVRHNLLSRFTETERLQLTDYIKTASGLNRSADQQLVNWLHLQPVAGQLDRGWFISLPHAVAKELLASWLRANDISYDRPALERLAIAA